MHSINRKKPENVRKYLIYPVTEGVVLALLALFLTAVTAFFIYHHALKAIKAEIQDGLLRTASGIAACLDGDLIATFDAPEKKDLPEYQAMLKLLQKARLATKHCTYLYVNNLVGEKVFFVLDPTPVDENGKPLFTDEMNLQPSIPMTEYKDASPELMQALTKKEKIVSSEPYTDQWGTFYSAYIPIYDSQKRFVGTLGADLKINDMLARCEPIEDATKRAFFVAVILAMLCGTLIWFTRRFSLQLNESRFKLLENLLDASEFADQTAVKIGRQLQRISMIFKNMAGRLNSIGREKSVEELQQLLKKEEGRLLTLSEKLAEAGEIKFSRREVDLDDFSVFTIKDQILGNLKNTELDFQRIGFNVDEKIPGEIYGSAQTYEELLSQMASFFLKMFSGSIKCEIKMIQEEARDLILSQKMSADISGMAKDRLDLLKHLCKEADKEEFFTELELAEATSVSVLRELIYLFNSDIKIDLAQETFYISFVSKFQKAFEESEEESEAETKE